MNIVEPPAKFLASRSARPLRGDRRGKIRHHRSAGAGALSGRDARHVPRPHPGGAAARLGRRGVGDRQARRRDRDRDRAARRQYRAGRRPGSAPRRGRALAQPPRPHPRGRSDLQHHHLRGGRDLAARARGGRRRRPALSAAAALGRHLHDRRQSLHQCRRHRRAGARHRALARARPRGRAGRRPRAQQPQQAQEGQYRLRSQEPVHRRRGHARHHHRGGAQAGAAPALGRDRVRRGAVAGGGARAARPRHRAHRRRRHQLRADAADGHRAGAAIRERLPRSAGGRRIPGTC